MSRTSTTARAFDAQMMAVAVQLIRHGLGTTAFNPSVGCVIADEATGEIVAQGWTQPGGRPHGEKVALRLAGARARGKTMYVTLEPCARTGRVPTCADAVITAGLKRVVCALADPNPMIAGRGFDQLRAAGVVVDVGLMADAARALTAGHILYVTEGRPFVQLKLAVSADGLIAPGDGRPVWVTGLEARTHGHLLRAEADAIITGIGTILADDPELTCRLPGLAGRSPHRVIVDTRARSPATAKALRRDGADGPNVWLATRPDAAQSAPAPVLAGMRLTVDGHIDLLHLIKTLTSHAIRRVLVEAGPRLSQSFLAQDLVDEMVVFRGALPISAILRHGTLGIEPLGANGLARFDGASWQLTDDRSVGPDRMLIYRRQRESL